MHKNDIAILTVIALLVFAFLAEREGKKIAASGDEQLKSGMELLRTVNKGQADDR